jgi:hypothetical protein
MNLKALGADNALREGIAAVSGRIQSGRLLIDPRRALTSPPREVEGSLYAYDPDGELVTELPWTEHAPRRSDLTGVMR